MPCGQGMQIREGKLFRSGNLSLATQEDIVYLKERVAVILDLRTGLERIERPNPFMEGVEEIWLPILEEAQVGIAKDEESNQVAVTMRLEDPESVKEYMKSVYRELATREYSRSQYAAFLRHLLIKREGAVLWHCTAGKDRTGTCAALIETILGVPEKIVMEDYLSSGYFLQREVEAFKEAVRRQRGRLSEAESISLEYLYGVEEEYLLSFIEEAESRYGSLADFIHEGLGISREEEEALRSLYLQKA